MTKKAKQPKQKDDSFWKKFQTLRLVVFSCHEKALATLREWASNVVPELRFHIYEYLLESPTHVASQADTPSTFVPFFDTEVTSKGYCLDMPQGRDKKGREFLDQIVKDLELVVKNKKKPFSFPLAFSSRSPTWDVVKRLGRMGPVTLGELSNGLYESWVNGKWRDSDVFEKKIWRRDAGREACLKEMKQKLGDKKLGTNVRLAWANIFSLIYTPLLTTPNTSDEIVFVAVPIASPLVFYGVLIVAAEVNPRYPLNEPQALALLNELIDLTERYYLPTIILGQNSWEESRAAEILKSKEGKDKSRDVLQKEIPDVERVYSNASLYQMNALLVRQQTLKSRLDYAQPLTVNRIALENYRLEESLLELWNNRTSPKCLTALALKTLVFRKMMVASPGMLDTVRSIIQAGRSIQPPHDKGDPLPSILVVGSHGSGKENVSRLIPLFTADYWDVEPQAINSASVSDSDALCQEIKKKVGGATKAVLRIDELNSLNVQVQGALLRLLEQGELDEQNGNSDGKQEQSGEPRNWLVVGMINEDPSQLTLGELRERTRDTFLFGQLLGTLLYEHLKTRSRMRDDLYYRVRRCGEIHVYDLDDRKEDIPIILYYLLRTRSLKDRDLFITYEALQQLVRPELRWRGNVRQLELVARELGSIIGEHPQAQVSVVSALEMREALRRAQMEERKDPNVRP